ncbi:armadillo repeat-containing protein 3 isoform X1 [Solea solea]|uniref:armadillo repeat-containing protein 3 isoform X1 n=2 Tax=Solea solea TaxID=90069 RepID=UPI002729C7B2|nr:armadillo repeat-containing protein 3 isoform X1 [Solea solea]
MDDSYSKTPPTNQQSSHTMGKKSGKKKETETPPQETFDTLLSTPATVVLLLRSPEEDILIKACEATHAFAEKGEEDKLSLLGLGVLEPLCQLITHSNKLIRRNAFMALGNMALNGDVKNALKKMDVIPSIIINLSAEEDIVVHEFATLCLAALSVDFVCKVKIFDNNGLPPLIQLLSSLDPDVQKNSLDVVFNLVQAYQYRVVVHLLGGIPPLLELLNSEFPVIQHLALKTLQNVTTDKDTRGTFREEQGFERIMDTLDNMDFGDLHAEALRVVANCLSDTESVHLIHERGGLARLMEFLLMPSMPEIQSNAVKCIARIALSSENRKLLHEQNVENVLVELLSTEDITVKTSACQAVTAMSFHLSSKERFRNLGAIPVMVELLKSESLKLREAATQVLCNLTHNNQLNSLAVYAAKGHKILIQQLCGSCPRAVANSAATLGTMARQEVIRCSILSQGAVQALVEPLKSRDTDVLVNTTLCLSLLSSDAEARSELQSSGGLPPLVNLLQTYNKDVLHNACLAISVLARDEPAAAEMCRYGALEMLQEINMSVNRRSNFSETAMKSLLDSNLSVKYSLTGQLASTNIISDGFYDAGKGRAGQRVLTLEEFANQPLNQRRPIIVVSTAYESSQDHVLIQRKKGKHLKLRDDISLQSLVKTTKECILPLDDEREQYAALARLVSEAMGGEVKKEKLHEFAWVLHISELKSQLQSNIIPIGLIKRGFYCHRALLFKYLADCIRVSSTLVRGEYDRAWNEVFFFTGNCARIGRCSQPSRYIVDLMHQPGSLLAANDPAAVRYQTI